MPHLSTAAQSGALSIPERIQAWREAAAVLRCYGHDHTADVVERMAAELEADTRTTEAARIGMAEAVERTGYTRGHLRRLIRDGKLRNVGSEEEPLLLPSELPRKPALSLAKMGDEMVDSKTQVIRAVVAGKQR
ncbi:MAG TPA: hypothetical protein VFE05_10425 [Longimicrobiaceae bacterium]|jgi:hypothetical protein|nr:hypothetical protein [Longimicrobiaceae bacterium]